MKVPTSGTWLTVWLAGCLLLSAACSKSTGPGDTIPPTPGNAGLITLTEVQQTACTLAWSSAVDDRTPVGRLQYALYRSTAPNLTTVTSTLTNGTLVLNLAVDTQTVTVTSLLPGTTYSFNVEVRDLADNRAAYTMASFATAIPGRLYWTETPMAGPSLIRRANLDGSGMETLVIAERHLFRLTLDTAGGKMYWTNPYTDKIYRANLNGTAVEGILSGLETPYGLALEIYP